MQTVQRHFTLTYFVLIGCRHGELGRIVRELQFVRHEDSHWSARAESNFPSHVYFMRCRRGLIVLRTFNFIKLIDAGIAMYHRRTCFILFKH